MKVIVGLMFILSVVFSDGLLCDKNSNLKYCDDIKSVAYNDGTLMYNEPLFQDQ